MVFLFFLIPLAVFLLTIIFPLAWVPLVFRVGIPFARKKYHIPTPADKQRLVYHLNRVFSGNCWQPGREFRQISENEIAFRGEYSVFLKPTYPNGLIRFIPEKETVIVTIHLDLLFLPFVAFQLMFIYSVLLKTFILALVVLIVYLLLGVYFVKIARQNYGEFAARIGRQIHSSIKAEREVSIPWHDPFYPTAVSDQR